MENVDIIQNSRIIKNKSLLNQQYVHFLSILFS